MVKKLVVLAVIFAVLCFAGVGCFRRGVQGGVHEGLYYDGPYRFGGGEYYYYNGGFYLHITTSATINITNSIIAIILTNGTHIRGIPRDPQDKKSGPQDRKNGGIKT
jgi:hypothetical protein